MRITANENIAIYQNRGNITYNELIGHCLSFANSFSLESGDMVGIISENRSEWIYIFYAVWRNHGIVIPIDFMSSSQEIAHILQDAKISTLFVSEQCRKQTQEAIEISGYIPNVYHIEEFTQRAEEKNPSASFKIQNLEFADDNQTSVMIYTSGTTGKPKGVMLSRKNLAANVEGILALGVFAPGDIVGALLPFHHIYPLTGTLVLTMVSGFSVALIEKLSSEAIAEAFQKHKITVLLAIPRVYDIFHQGIMNKIRSSTMARILFTVAKVLPSMAVRKKIFAKVHKNFGGNLRYFLSGGSKLDDQIMYDFGVLGIDLAEGYGLSETSPLCSANNVPEVFKRGSLGKTLVNMQVKIEDGEICVRGENVMKGYYNLPQETAEVLKDDWFYTGDAGYLDKDGYITITGRKRELIVLPNGKKLNPEEVEREILHTNPDMIQEVGVFAHENGLFALILPNFEFLAKNNLPNAVETIRWQVVDKYNRTARGFKKILNFKLIADELPRTRIGKLKRFMFSSLVVTQADENRNHPPDPQEEDYALLKNFLQTLSGKDVYPDSYLELDLGFDSLARIETESFIEGKFGVSISQDDLTGDTSVEKLYRMIKAKEPSEPSEPDKNDSMPPSEDDKSKDILMGWGDVLQQKIERPPAGSSFFLHFVKIFFAPLFLFYIRIESFGREKISLSANSKPVLFTPNHQSFLDALLLLTSLPHKIISKTYFIANNRHFTSKFSRWLAKHSNMLIVDINLHLKESLQKIALLLKEKKNVVIFPEGARTRDGHLMEFKKFFAILSKELKIPVVPVVIEGAMKALPIDSIFPRPAKILLTFSEPISLFQAGYDEICQQVRRVIEMKLTESNAQLSNAGV